MCLVGVKHVFNSSGSASESCAEFRRSSIGRRQQLQQSQPRITASSLETFKRQMGNNSPIRHASQHPASKHVGTLWKHMETHGGHMGDKWERTVHAVLKNWETHGGQMGDNSPTRTSVEISWRRMGKKRETTVPPGACHSIQRRDI